MSRTVIRNQVIGVLRKAAGSYTTDDPVKVPGIKGQGANLEPMAAQEKKSPGPTSTTCGREKAGFVDPSAFGIMMAEKRAFDRGSLGSQAGAMAASAPPMGGGAPFAKPAKPAIPQIGQRLGGSVQGSVSAPPKPAQPAAVGAMQGAPAKTGSFGQKLAMMKVGPASMSLPIGSQRDKDKAQQKLHQTI